MTIYIPTIVNTLIFHEKNDGFSIKNDDFLHELLNFCRPSIHRERKKNNDFAMEKKNMNLE